MLIEEQDFKLIQSNSTSTCFDLELLSVVNKGKSNERTEFKVVGYGMTLERALHIVIMNRINNKYEGNINLKTFLKEFKEEVNNLKKLIENE